MTPVRRFWLMSFLMALPSVVSAAGKYSWFDDLPGAAGATDGHPSAVGVEVYRSTDKPNAGGALSGHKVSLFGNYSLRGTRGFGDGEGSARKLANFGVRWQHRVSASDSVAVSAQQGDSMLWRSAPMVGPDALDTRAIISWTRQLPWAWKPSVTGGVFLGDENTRDDVMRFLGRRYYGFSIGGELRLFEAHTPYVTFRMERSLYGVSGEDSTVTGLMRTTEDSSRLAAGWRWQAMRGLSFQAEASYDFSFGNTTESLPLERERSRVFFGTRFDFR